MIGRLEAFFFEQRSASLVVFLVFTLLMAFFAVQLRMSAGFDRRLPLEHEYIRTFVQYKDLLFGANRITVVLRAKSANVWTKPCLTRLLEVTDALTLLPGVDRATVRSLWTPNVFFTEITEDGFKAEPVIGGDIVPQGLTADVIERIRARTVEGGHIGTLVANDFGGAMITADLNEKDPKTGKVLDYVEFNRLLDDRIRAPYQDDQVEIQIIGFAREIGEITAGAQRALRFFALALLLTALLLYGYCHSFKATFLVLASSLTSLIWQFGTLKLLGIDLDPLAILVPFLVFAIGVSHGVQQINFIMRARSDGLDADRAARKSFSALLVPGVLSIMTAFSGFATLYLVPVPLIRELALVAAIGVFYKMFTNLLMLPLIASTMTFPGALSGLGAWGRAPSRLLVRAVKFPVPVIAAGVLIALVALWQGQGRQIGSLQNGSPELNEASRFNRDTASIAQKFDIGQDWLSVVFEMQAGCMNPQGMLYIEDFGWQMAQVEGVLSTDSLVDQLKLYNAGMNEGNPGMTTITRDERGLGSQVHGMNDRIAGLSSADCKVQVVNLYLADHKAETIRRVVEAVKAFAGQNRQEGVNIRLAGGNAGILAAVNEVLEKGELPMLAYVYLCVVLLVFLAYRNWKAVIACSMPLIFASSAGYWFMNEFHMGLSLATLPVMVLSCGIGVDYAFYIYNRIRFHRLRGMGIESSVEDAMRETGNATMFTALTLSIGVATWSFSELRFQADMGKLLSFMFMINMIAAMTLLPALVIVLEKIVPDRGRL